MLLIIFVRTKRIFSLLLGSTTLLFAGGADAAETITVKTPPPFDRWCVKPLCEEPGAAPAPVKAPPPVATSGLSGYAEAKLRAAIAAQIDEWVKGYAAQWNVKPVRDVARAAIAALSDDASALEKSQGLATALLRAGLTLHLDRALPEADGCAEAARRDAIYEGLSITRALGVLAFPESDKTVLATCKSTVDRTVDAIDGELLRALDPDGKLGALASQGKALLTSVTAAAKTCEALPPSDPAAQSATVKALAQARAKGTVRAYVDVLAAVKADQATIAAWTEGPAAECAGAVGKIAKIDAGPFVSDLGKSLAAVDLATLLPKLDESVLACASPACRETKELVLVLRQGLDEKALRALVAHVRGQLGLTVKDSSAFAGVLRALDAAIVSADIDPAAFVRTLTSEYGLDEDGHLSPLSLIKPAPLVLEANAGMPRLKSDEVRLVGDLTLGWKTTALGAIANGSVSYYDFSSATGSTNVARYHGALEAWYLSGDERSSLRFTARLTGGVDYYDATYNPQSTGSGYFHDEDSTLVRGLLMLGVRVQASNFFLDLMGGGGAQYESYGYLNTDPKDPNVLSDTTGISARYSGRMLMRWRAWPQVLALRARAEGSMFTLTRDLFTVSQINRPLSTSITTTSLSQTELSVRGFLDLDVAKFFGFVPSAWAGFDYVGMKDDAGDVQTTVPVFGLGIMRPTF